MKTLCLSKWKLDGVLDGNVCFVSKKWNNTRILCGAICKVYDTVSGSTAVIRASGDGYEAEWSYSTLRKAIATNMTLPNLNEFINSQSELTSLAAEEDKL